MGGYAGGEIASQTVGDAIIEYVRSNHGKRSPIDVLKGCLAFANDELMLKRLSLALQKMGTVVAVLYIIDDNSYLTWLGDSRIYLYRDNKEVYRTEDHSLINELVKSNSIRSGDIGRYRSIVTKSIMGEENGNEAPIRKIKIVLGDVFVLCTDGFYKEVDIEKAKNFKIEDKKKLDALCNVITDNYSFVTLRI